MPAPTWNEAPLTTVRSVGRWVSGQAPAFSILSSVV
jgi:hypothetical protein